MFFKPFQIWRSAFNFFFVIPGQLRFYQRSSVQSCDVLFSYTYYTPTKGLCRNNSLFPSESFVSEYFILLIVKQFNSLQFVSKWTKTTLNFNKGKLGQNQYWALEGKLNTVGISDVSVVFILELANFLSFNTSIFFLFHSVVLPLNLCRVTNV